jgi:HEAT repeat protein
VPDILMGFGGKIEEPLLEALKIDNKWTKVGAISVLGRRQSEKAVFPLISLLEDQEPLVRDEAAVGLSRINSENSVKPLLELLKYEASYVREEAAWVLGEMRSMGSVRHLIEALDDEDSGWMAAVALGKIGDKQAAEPLRKKAANQDTRVGQAAAWALSRMKSESRNDG